jgi:RNA polymerase sigma-70 factor (ECF subfamily)
METYNYSPFPDSENHTSEELHPLQTGDNAAWEEFYHSNERAFMSTAINSGAPTIEDAEDAVQTGLLRLYEGQTRKVIENPRAYVHTVTRNYSIDLTRKQKNRKTYNEQEVWGNEYQRENVFANPIADAPDPSPTPEEIAIHNDLMSSVVPALEKINSDHKEIILFTYRGEYTHSECAAQLQIPLGTVKTRLYRGLQSLSKLLSPVSTSPHSSTT